MTLCLPFELCRDPDMVGGKAINLARLLHAGLPVPGGFAVTTAAWRSAATTPGEFPDCLPTPVREAIVSAYASMGRPVVAVRSSATAEDMAGASMAGQYETILDVQGDDAICDAVLRCWQSVDTPRVRSYLAEQGIDINAVAMAVAVQELVPSDCAGVLFTVNPRSGRDDEMLIESSWGLGEAVVGALVQPDTLVVARDDGSVRHAVIADKTIEIVPGSHAEQAVPDDRRRKPSLSASQVDELRALGEQVERVYGHPQDLEWAFANERLFLLQSRNITTLNAVPERIAAHEAARLAAARDHGTGPWVRHNISETLPHPSPLTWSLIERFMSGAGGFGNLYRAVGFDPAPGTVLELIGGRPYLDLSTGGNLFWADYPFSYDLDLLRSKPDAAQEPPTIPDGDPATMRAANQRLAAIGAGIAEIAADLDQQLLETHIPAFRAWTDQEMANDLSALDSEQLLKAWHSAEQRILDDFAPLSLLPSVVCADAIARLTQDLAPWCWDENPAAVADRIALGGPANSTVRSASRLRAVALGQCSRDEWLVEFGHRAPTEFDLATPRWHERPNDIDALAAGMRDAEDPLERHRQASQHSESECAALCTRMPASSADAIRSKRALLQRYLSFREDGKHELMRGYAVLRRLALETGRRLGIGDDVFLLDQDHFLGALHSGYAPLQAIDQARQRHKGEAALHLPAVIDTAELDHLGQAPEPQGGDRLDGFAIAAGSGSGPVRIVFSPEQAGEAEPGYVLVCPSTDPSWTPLFVNAAALVLERGGALSHGAVVARELGIPAVVLDGATSILTANETIQVDGSRGRIHRGAIAASSEHEPAADQALSYTLSQADLPPPPGPKCRSAARWRSLSLLVWGLYLAAAFWPGTWSVDAVYQPSIALLDALLWPLASVISGAWTVTVVAIVMAICCIGLQALVTDNPRLRCARDRAAALRKRATRIAGQSDAASETAVACKAAAGPVQWRLLGASMVPVGLLLGPMIMVVFWLTDRIEATPSVPGTPVQVIAEIDGEYQGSITAAGEHLAIDTDMTPVTQSPPAIRSTLEQLRRDWSRSKPDTDLAWDLRAAARAARDASLADLDAYLAGPMPSQELSWTVIPQERAGILTLDLRNDAGKSLAQVPLRFGAEVAPSQVELVERPGLPARLLPVHRFGNGPVTSVTLQYQDQLVKDADTAFFRPFAWLGWDWDTGWIVLYILVYVPAMLIAKRLMRVP